MFSGAQVDGPEGRSLQDRQDVTKMDPNDTARFWSTYRGSDYPTGTQSINAASADVVQSGGIIIRVGTIGCSAYGFQRCNEFTGV